MKMFQTVLRLLAVSLLLTASTAASAALNAYMTIEGSSQGNIEGDVTRVGLEDHILVESVGYNLTAPLDAASGLPTGKRQHRPVRIIKPVDKATPKLFMALTTNEVLTDVVIKFYKPNFDGNEVHYFTIELLDARIISVSPSHSSIGEGISEPVREAVSFVFTRIIMTDELNGTTAEDTWSSGRN
jgi:type VI secretion system secreted protein Hcp